MRLEDNLDFVDVCRDEKCPREEIHRAHAPIQRARHRWHFEVTKRGLILEATLAAVNDRLLKSFQQVFHTVIDDYGSLKPRTIYRALAELQVRRLVAMVVPSGSIDKLRGISFHPDGRVKTGFVKGGYIRYDSPLLWQRDGLYTLIEQADDMRRELAGFMPEKQRWADAAPSKSTACRPTSATMVS
jgi:hypothetical protein